MSKKHNQPKTEVEKVAVQTLENELGLDTVETSEPTQEDEQLDLLETENEETELQEEEEEEVTEETSEEDARGKLVTDANGIPLFRKLKPTYESPEVKGKQRTRVATKTRARVKQYEISGNAALITFPTDRYGITKDIKTAMIRAASRIAGDANKKQLVEEVVAILSEHIEIKFNADRAYREKLAKAGK